MRKRKWITEKDRDRWIGQGYGQGIGAGYKSWMRVRDVPSAGRSTRVPGSQADGKSQEHQLLSMLEWHAYLLLKFCRGIAHIYDQYALLPVQRSVQLAAIAGVRHPKYPGTRTDIVMTTDLVLQMEDGQLYPFYVKYAHELNPDDPACKRTLEKLYLEASIWADRGKQLTVLTDRPISSDQGEIGTTAIDSLKARNLEKLYPATVQPEANRLNPLVQRFAQLFVSWWQPDLPLSAYLDETVSQFGVSAGDAYKLFAKAVWELWLPIDLSDELIVHSRPVKLLPFTVLARPSHRQDRSPLMPPAELLDWVLRPGSGAKVVGGPPPWVKARRCA